MDRRLHKQERGLTKLPSYHLGLKPGQEVLDAIGGAHRLQGWNRNILTDSGGLVFYLHSAKELSLTPILVSKWSPS